MALSRDQELRKRLEVEARRAREAKEREIAFEQQNRKKAAIARITRELEAARRDLAKRTEEDKRLKIDLENTTTSIEMLGRKIKNKIEEGTAKGEQERMRKKADETKGKINVLSQKISVEEAQKKSLFVKIEGMKREIVLLDQGIEMGKKEKTGLEQKLKEVLGKEEGSGFVVKRKEIEDAVAKRQIGAPKNARMQKETRARMAAMQYATVKKTVADLEQELRTAQSGR